MKQCWNCLKEKELSEFYKHKLTKDGYLGKCKECTRSDVKNRYNKKMLEPEWREAELKRIREKSARQRLGGKRGFTKEAAVNWRSKYPYKRKAHGRVAAALRSGRLVKLPCERCGFHEASAHHDDYSKPLDVIWLCRIHHDERHRELRQIKEYGKIIPV